MFEINGVKIQTPKRHGWQKRNRLGINGEGNPVYSNYLSYQMQWPIMLPEEFDKLLAGFEASQASGTCSITLPEWDANSYATGSYTAVAYEPTYQSYFDETYLNAKMIFAKIEA